MPNGTCFVVMGFGVKTDFETGRSLDLNKSYENMIKPAVELAGLSCVRADEIVHSGEIDLPMYQQLLSADVVVADLSTSNKNAFYELGVRHALRPYTTVVICEDGMKPMAFDVNHILVRTYHHLGEDIGTSEAKRFIQVLSDAIIQIMQENPREYDSPVYTFLNTLKQPQLAEAVKEAVDDASTSNQTATNVVANTDDDLKTHSEMMKEVDKAQKEKNWLKAKMFLSTVRDNLKEKDPVKEDSYILQKLALVTYKSKYPTEVDALKEARGLLQLLSPIDTNDPETLGLWGSVHKRLWELTKGPDYLDESVRAYERGFYIRNDYYNGINYAFLLNVRAAETAIVGGSIADFVQANRIREEVLTICQKWINTYPLPAGSNVTPKALEDYWKTAYWVYATAGEAYTGLGNGPLAAEALAKAYLNAAEAWMPDTTKEQIDKLQELLDISPLRFIKEDAN